MIGNLQLLRNASQPVGRAPFWQWQQVQTFADDLTTYTLADVTFPGDGECIIVAMSQRNTTNGFWDSITIGGVAMQPLTTTTGMTNPVTIFHANVTAGAKAVVATGTVEMLRAGFGIWWRPAISSDTFQKGTVFRFGNQTTGTVASLNTRAFPRGGIVGGVIKRDTSAGVWATVDGFTERASVVVETVRFHFFDFFNSDKELYLPETFGTINLDWTSTGASASNRITAVVTPPGKPLPSA